MSLRSLARCLTDEFGISISFKHLQRITKDMGIRCKRPKLELLHDLIMKKEKRECKIINVYIISEKKSDVSILR